MRAARALLAAPRAPQAARADCSCAAAAEVVCDCSRTTTVLAPFVTAAVCVDCMAFAQQFTFAINFCCWSSGRPTTSRDCQRTATWAQNSGGQQLCTSLAQVSNDALRSAHANRESRRAMTRRSHCDIVWHTAWRAKANRNAIALGALRY